MFSIKLPYCSPLTSHLVGVYTLYVAVHFLAPYLYTRFCTPWTLAGFLASPFVAPAPHCRALRWAFFHTATQIDAMWLLAGTWVVSSIVAPTPHPAGPGPVPDLTEKP